MKNEAFHPDLGIHLHAQGLREGARIQLGEVPIHNLKITGGGVYTTFMSAPYKGRTFGASFDFSDEILPDLLRDHSINAVSNLLRAGRRAEFDPPIVVPRLRCILGPLTLSRTDRFRPFLVIGLR